MHTFFNRISPAQILFEADGKGGGGGGSSTVEAKLPDDVVEGFRNLISKEGGGKDAAATLFLENKSLRDDRRELQEKIDKYEAVSEDPEELKKKFQAYEELGDPEDLEEKIENAESAQQELSQLKREKQHSEVADVLGWNPKVLNRLSGEDAEYEIKTRKNNEGEDEQYAVLKTEDGEKDLAEHAQSEWGDMMPALKATGENGEQDTSSSGKNFTKQKSSGNGKSNDGGYLKKAIQKNHKAAGIASDEDE